uniref:Uncharacterized protein n=1 Tax=Cyprinus carpio TaxID=7962 RepID=A0A8C2KM12_CYPCA
MFLCVFLSPQKRTTITLNKISDLAWQVLSLENDTAHALGLISEELKKMREAVIQNRLVLDILTLERGGGWGLDDSWFGWLNSVVNLSSKGKCI